MIIGITNQQKKIPLPPKKTIAIAKKILRSQGIHHAHLSLVFVTDSRIKKLNKKYLHKDSVTDVLAFDLGDPTPSRTRQLKRLNAEIIISTATVYRNSKIYATTPWEELVLCLVHGILHLTGFDDYRPIDQARMRKRERQLWAFILKSKKILQ